MDQSGGHIQQLNAGNEGNNTGGDMGVFYGGFDRSIGQNLSFLDSTEITQGGNDVASTVATSTLQFATSPDAASV